MKPNFFVKYSTQDCVKGSSATTTPKGRVKVHQNEKRDTYRLRFNSVHPDRADTILFALEVARKKYNTEFDAVALDYMCLQFLESQTGKPAKPESEASNETEVELQGGMKPTPITATVGSTSSFCRSRTTDMPRSRASRSSSKSSTLVDAMFRAITGNKLARGKDVILQVANRIENQRNAQALDLLKTFDEARTASAFVYGGLLCVIGTNHAYQLAGHDSFKAFVEDEIGISESTADDFVHFYERILESEITWDQVKNIGWSKLRLISPVLTDMNVEELITHANEMTQGQLRVFFQDKASA